MRMRGIYPVKMAASNGGGMEVDAAGECFCHKAVFTRIFYNITES